METNQESRQSKFDQEVQRSICLQESEIQRLSQAYADKYYYEMKFEQYQNLLAQQQTTITKILNEKRELQQKLEEVSGEERQDSEQLQQQFDDAVLKLQDL